eukprot:TRINITY_DN49_c0_g1_i1.p1 TRINITY_DN49_c0_g1~~TRINITY_DN49_c0_g1_i1.p1  ORF type:complete len:1018 (-),score=253.35 TRINITY_DN49_c0_g1_i1:24-3014(-)
MEKIISEHKHSFISIVPEDVEENQEESESEDGDRLQTKLDDGGYQSWSESEDSDDLGSKEEKLQRFNVEPSINHLAASFPSGPSSFRDAKPFNRNSHDDENDERFHTPEEGLSSGEDDLTERELVIEPVPQGSEDNLEIEEHSSVELDVNFEILNAFESRMGIEIILYIFSFLSLSDIGRLCRVCKSFKHYASNPQLNQWKYLSLFPFRRRINDHLVYRIVRPLTYIRSLDLRYCKMLKSTRCLEKLLLSHCLDSLEVLDLSGTVFKEDSLLELSMKFLATCQYLVFIDFSWTKLNKAQTIQNLLQSESTRQEFALNKRKKTLVLRFSSSLHIRSGEKLLRNMNVQVEFIEKRDNNTKLKLLLFPYPEEVHSEVMPQLPISGSLRAKAAIPLWKVGLFTYTTLKLNTHEVDDVFPEDYVELYYNNTLLFPIYSMSLASILDSFVFNKNSKAAEGITLFYRKVSVAKRREHRVMSTWDRGGAFCPICLWAFPQHQLPDHLTKCGLVHIEKALDLPEGVHHLLLDEIHPWKKKTRSSREIEAHRSEIVALDYDEETLCWAHGKNVALIPNSENSELMVRGVVTCIHVNPITKALLFGFREGDILYANHLQKHERTPLEFNRYGCLNVTAVTAVHWIPDSTTQFVVAFADGNIYFFDITKPIATKVPKNFTETKKTGVTVLHNKKETNPIALLSIVGEEWQVNDIKFAPGTSLMALNRLTCIAVYDIERERFVAHIQEKDGPHSQLSHFFCMSWSHDARFIAVGRFGSITVWDFLKRTAIDLGTIPPAYQVSSIEFDLNFQVENSYRIGCVTYAGIFGMWQLEPSRKESPLQPLCSIDLGGRLTSVVFLPSSIAVSWHGGRVRMWKRPEGTPKISGRVKSPPRLMELCLRIISSEFHRIPVPKNLGMEISRMILRHVAPHVIDGNFLRQVNFEVEKSDKRCRRCGNSFNVFRHRHLCAICHCTMCGSCSKHFDLANLPDNSTNSVAVCGHCHPLLLQAS